MSYKVGDKVRVRRYKALMWEFGITEEEGIKTPCITFMESMQDYCGDVLTIRNVATDGYLCNSEKAGAVPWRWTDVMFEGYAFEYGDRIEVSDDGKHWYKRIYVGYIDGADFPYAVVSDFSMDKYRNGEKFTAWYYQYARPIPQPTIEVKIFVNGKETNEPLSVETAKRLRIIK